MRIHSKKELKACPAAKAARRASRRNAEREGMRDVVNTRQLAKLTPLPPASISAQLRHLRKPEYGGFAVEKRPRYRGRGPAR